MDEETVHRGHEMDALMQASMGDEEDHVSKNTTLSVRLLCSTCHLLRLHTVPGGGRVVSERLSAT